MRCVLEGGDAVESGFDVAHELMRSVLEGGESNVFRRGASTTALATAPFISLPLHRRCSKGCGVAWIFTIAPQVPAVLFHRPRSGQRFPPYVPVRLILKTHRDTPQSYALGALRSRSPNFKNPPRHSTSLQYALGSRRCNPTMINSTGKKILLLNFHRDRSALSLLVSLKFLTLP